ncbi:calcium/calmodulin-dependent protein kinase type II-like [Oratosquilla oratoria]|uniref:calcium/calmodulin-dependent protein kinase type II-like n=1 Tax=Oratosquilla oratoria TaxID=337810 RepID=UPI003F773EC4
MMARLRKFELTRLRRFFVGVIKSMVCCCCLTPRNHREKEDSPNKSSRNPPKDQEARKTEGISPGKEASVKSRHHTSLPQKKGNSLEGRQLSTSKPVVEPTETPVNAQSCSKQTIDYNENYTFKSDLGSGGYAITSLVIGKTTGNICVAKIPTKDKGSLSEIQALAELTHPNVVRLVDVATQGKLNVIITEYCEGGTLDSAVSQHAEQPYQDWGDRVASYCEQLVRAVAYVHSKNLAHLDLKTENIVLSADHKIVKLIDFGMSR